MPHNHKGVKPVLQQPASHNKQNSKLLRAQNCKQFTNSQSSKLHKADYQIEDITNIYTFSKINYCLGFTSVVNGVCTDALASYYYVQANMSIRHNIVLYIPNSYFDFFLRGLFLETAVPGVNILPQNEKPFPDVFF